MGPCGEVETTVFGCVFLNNDLGDHYLKIHLGDLGDDFCSGMCLFGSFF